MSIPLTGAGGYFTIAGKLGKLNKDVASYLSATLAASIDTALTQFDGTNYREVASSLAGGRTSYLSTPTVTSTSAVTASSLLLKMVKADNPQFSDTDAAAAVAELIKQMKAGSATIKAATIGISSAVFTSPANNGNGAVVMSTKRGDGLVQENAFAETATLACTGDAQSGTATSGSEPFRFTGDALLSDVWAYNWPGGSGASASMTAIDGSLNSSSTNLMQNSSFTTFTSNTPDSWTITVGVAGTDVKKSTSVFYDGSESLEIVGGATLTALTQAFGQSATSAGSTAKVYAGKQYAVNLFAKVDVVPAAGVLTVDLIDGSGTVINDDQGTANSFTVTLSSLTTSFAAKNGTFRLPRVLPSTVKIRLRISTALSAGSSLFIDRMAMGEMTKLYAGGPSVAVFSGSTPWVINDGWNLTVTNDRGGSTFGASWQSFFDRVFGMRAMDLLLPSAGSPTISDTLLN